MPAGFRPRFLAVLAFAAAGTGLRAAPGAIPYGDNPAAGHYTEVNGIKLYYETYGAGTPVVILHGSGGSIADLHFQDAYFSTHYRVIAIDSRGCGKSEMGAGELTYAKMADDVAALLAQLRAPPADFIGWSDGGIIALLVAIRHPAAVAKLAISGANLFPEGLTEAAQQDTWNDLHQAEAMLQAGDQSQPWADVIQEQHLMAYYPHLTPAELRGITASALVMAGEHDLILPEHTRLICESIPHARLHIFPDVGHATPIEAHAAFNQLVSQFSRAAHP